MRQSGRVQKDLEPGAAGRGTERWFVGALGLLRLAQLLPWLAVVATGRWYTYRNPALVSVFYIGYVWWAVLLFWNGRRRQGFSVRWITADVAVNSCCLVVVGSLCVPGYATTWQNWTLGPAMGTAILSMVWWGWRGGIVVGITLSVAYAFGVRGDLTVLTSATGTVIGSVVSLMAFTIAAGFVAD